MMNNAQNRETPEIPEIRDVRDIREVPEIRAIPAAPEVRAMPPVRTPWGLYRLMRDFQRDPTGFISSRCAEYGDMFYMRFGKVRRYVTRHPEHIREALVDKGSIFIRPKDDINIIARYFRFILGDGLLVSNGELWRRQRRMINPALHRKRIEGHADTMASHIGRMLDGWRDGVSFDLSAELTRLNLAILTQSLFDYGTAEQSGEFMQLMETMHDTFGTASLLFLPGWLRVPGEIHFRRSIARVDRLIYRMIDERRALGEEALAERNDLLSALILATDDEASQPGERRMTRRLLRDELLTLCLAGSDTTSNTLTWTFYLLSQHPEIEARLLAEVDEVLGDRLPTLSDLRRLPFAEMVLQETMRLYPPGPIFARTASEDTEIAGHKIPRGSEISFWVYLAHHDPRWFPEPEVFRPERFAKDAPAPPRGAYIPFGIGSRSCIGKEYALMEARLMLAMILQRFRLGLLPDQEIALNFALTLSPRSGLRMRPCKRSCKSEELSSRAARGGARP